MRLYLKLLTCVTLTATIHLLIPPAIGTIDEAQFAARAFCAEYLRSESREQVVAAAGRLLVRERARVAVAQPELFPNGPVKLESPLQDDYVAAANERQYFPCDSSTQELRPHRSHRDCPSSQETVSGRDHPTPDVPGPLCTPKPRARREALDGKTGTPVVRRR
jgi:hypothetical protein